MGAGLRHFPRLLTTQTYATDFPPTPQKARPPDWFPCTQSYRQRPQGARRTPRQGPQTPDRRLRADRPRQPLAPPATRSRRCHAPHASSQSSTCAHRAIFKPCGRRDVATSATPSPHGFMLSPTRSVVLTTARRTASPAHMSGEPLHLLSRTSARRQAARKVKRALGSSESA